MEQLPNAHLHNYFYSAVWTCGTILWESEHVSSINPLCLGRQFFLTTTRVVCSGQPRVEIDLYGWLETWAPTTTNTFLGVARNTIRLYKLFSRNHKSDSKYSKKKNNLGRSPPGSLIGSHVTSHMLHDFLCELNMCVAVGVLTRDLMPKKKDAYAACLLILTNYIAASR